MIASKYKEYNKIRRLLAQQITVRGSPKSIRKRQQDGHVTRTPSKRYKIQTVTPRKVWVIEPRDSQLSPTTTTPISKPLILGPTPQKDGKILGIFDLLNSVTPNNRDRAAFEDLQNNIVTTPSKFDKLPDSPDMKITIKDSRTPVSSSKRFLLDSLVTPMKRKSGEDGTPSLCRDLFATPSFLRRDNPVSAPVIEGIPSPEIPRPLKRRVIGRSLSNIIEELRKVEDTCESAYEDDLDAMRELEVAESRRSNIPKATVEDSQACVTLDVDGFVPSDFEHDLESAPEMETNGASRKPWKKKGLKRQTKRVIMRPVKKQLAEVSVSEASGNGDVNTVAETQHLQTGNCVDVNNGDNAASDFDDWSESSELKAAPKTMSAKMESRKGPEQKRGRNANATVHANFRKLKIKNKNSKAKGRGRFASRR